MRFHRKPRRPRPGTNKKIPAREKRAGRGGEGDMVTIFFLYAIPTYRVEGKFHNHQIALEMGLADELQDAFF